MNKELLLRPENTKGHIFMLDYIWLEDLPLSNKEFSNKLFSSIENIINKSQLKIVHKNLTLLPLDGFDSEEGFTLFFSLDSSHCSAHCYWKSKLLAIDLFGCSNDNDYQNILNEIDDTIKDISNNISKAWFGSQKRFHFVS